MKCPHCGHQRDFRQKVTVSISATVAVNENGDFVYFTRFLTHLATESNIIEKMAVLTCPECERTFSASRTL
jgi:DNA-directed RNA polymerase subunit RPC12/RpoP